MDLKKKLVSLVLRTSSFEKTQNEVDGPGTLHRARDIVGRMFRKSHRKGLMSDFSSIL